MDHPLDFWYHPLQYVCSPFEVKGEGELIGEVVVEMVAEVIGRDGEGGRGTPELTLPTSILPPPPPSPNTYPSPEIFIPPQTYTSPSIPSDTYTSLPYSVSPESSFIAVDITLSFHPLLPPIGDTIVNLVSELGELLFKRPRASCIRQVLHPSAPLAPSAPFEIAWDPIDQLVVYSRRRPKRNISHLVGLIDIC